MPVPGDLYRRLVECAVGAAPDSSRPPGPSPSADTPGREPLLGTLKHIQERKRSPAAPQGGSQANGSPAVPSAAASEAAGRPGPASPPDAVGTSSEGPHAASGRGYKMATRLLHPRKGVTQEPYGAVSPPIYQTATFNQVSAVTTGEYDYTRSGNPTRTLLERQMADVEVSPCFLAASHGSRGPLLTLELCLYCGLSTLIYIFIKYIYPHL